MPDPQSVHTDSFLSRIAFGFTIGDLIAKKIAPVIPVIKQSNRYRIHEREHMRPVPDLRAPKAQPNKVDWGYSSDSYFCNEHALRVELSKEDLSNVDNDLDLFKDSSRTLKGKLELGLEADMAALVGAAATYPAAAVHTPVIKWDAADCIPLEDVLVVAEAIATACGMWPTTAVMGKSTYENCRRLAAFLDMTQYTKAGLLSPEVLREFLGVKELIVGDVYYNTVKKGQPDDMASLWGDDWIAFLYRGAINQSAVNPASFGIFQWTTPHAAGSNITIEKEWVFDNKIWAVDASWHWDIKPLVKNDAHELIAGGLLHTIFT